MKSRIFLSLYSVVLHLLWSLANWKKRLWISPCLSVRMEKLGSHWTDFHKIWYVGKCRKFIKQSDSQYNPTSIMGNLYENVCTFMITYRWILLRMRNFWDKGCREQQNTYFMFNNFCSENRALYEIMWKNMVEPDRPQMTIRRMRIARWIQRLQTPSQHT